MEALNFKNYPFRLKKADDKLWIFDPIRRKYVVLQPEEWVRQHVVHFLIEEKGYPKSLINVEKKLSVNGLTKRYDVVVYSKKGIVLLVVECKAPNVTITQQTFDQIARYNLSLNAQYLMVTNGINHYYCQMDYNQYKYIFLTDLPHYNNLTL
ncbi:restriction endonuclease subunit R [Capnocytophaga sp. HP1101]